MLWMNDIDLEIQSFSKNHVDALINCSYNNRNRRITCFCVHPNVNLRYITWNLLRTLPEKFILPWLCLGDYNEIINNNEKYGGSMRSEAQMNNFRETIVDYGFIEFPTRGPFYTCSRGSNNDIIFERLTVLSLKRNDGIFFLTQMRHILPTLILIISDKWSSPNRVKRKCIFMFEGYWTRYEGCKETVKQVWRAVVTLEVKDISHKLNSCGKVLSDWSRKHIGNIANEVKKKEFQLNSLIKNIDTTHDLNVITTCKNKLKFSYPRRNSLTSKI